ncbi:unnamed protein product [Ostreobium quekettii]|uniref:Uncharacterized protein n=1 Tax=Ostreobium quekettii TaxID=121088 RepID=A0A8S1IKB3_9CHLO|nr:unnamed protein product [Ostreobium quekettii]
MRSSVAEDGLLPQKMSRGPPCSLSVLCVGIGLPEDNDWVLYGPEADKTMGMRNLITYALARASGRYAARTRYCEVFLVADGGKLSKRHYHGVYILAEKLKRGNERIDIKKREGDDLSGGYIFKYDNDNNDPGDTVFAASLSNLLMIVTYPKSKAIKEKEVSWIKSFEAALIAEEFDDPVEGYLPFIDLPSFVDYWIVSEISKNPDSYRGSAFMHKDRGGPLKMGPVWDYNEAFGTCCGFPIEGFQNNGRSTGRSGGSAISPEGWRFSICAEPWRCRVDPLDGVSLWYRRLWQDPSFRASAEVRWTRLRAGAFSDERVKGIIADARLGLKDAALRNYKRWKRVLGGGNDAKNAKIWQAEVDALETWLMERLLWMDAQLLGELPSLGEIPDSSDGGQHQHQHEQGDASVG